MSDRKSHPDSQPNTTYYIDLNVAQVDQHCKTSIWKIRHDHLALCEIHFVESSVFQSFELSMVEIAQVGDGTIDAPDCLKPVFVGCKSIVHTPVQASHQSILDPVHTVWVHHFKAVTVCHKESSIRMLIH